MKLHSMLPFRTAIISIIGLAVHVHAGDGLTNAYCSTDNTGVANGPYYNIYQSMGSCATQCQQTYAFAVLQGKDCWCSDYIPGSVTNNANCNSPCPGFPSDLCGNPSEGLFGYVALNIAPSGTSGVKPVSQLQSFRFHVVGGIATASAVASSVSMSPQFVQASSLIVCC